MHFFYCSSNFSHLEPDDIRGQISVHIFAPNRGYCSRIPEYVNMYSQTISSEPRTVIKGKMSQSSVKLSIQMPFFSFTVCIDCRLDLRHALSFGTSVCCAIICLFMAGFLGAYSVFKMTASKQTPKLVKVRSCSIDSKILMGGEKFLSPL